jgi:hypothetical protein
MNKSFYISLLSAVMLMTLQAQSLIPHFLPKFIQGNTGTNSNRIPFVYRVGISGLTANATYRYFNQVVKSTDSDTINGSGNCIFVSTSGNFNRSSNPSLRNIGGYGTFITDANGSYEGWFITEPTGNARFLPGSYVFMRIVLNDGGSGTTVSIRLTTSDSVKVVKLDPAMSDSTGTGLRCASSTQSKDFILLYDNPDGAGRPISGAMIENDGTDNNGTNNYASFYSNFVNGVDGAFAAILPNDLPQGIRRIDHRALTTGSLVGFVSDADGLWPSGVNTVNPTGGTSELILANSDIQWTNDVSDAIQVPNDFILSQNFPNPFNPTTTIEYSIPSQVKSQKDLIEGRNGMVMLIVYDLLGREVQMLVNEQKNAGKYSVTFNPSNLSSGIYVYTLTCGVLKQTKQMLLLK